MDKTSWRHMRRHEEHIYCFVGADSCRGAAMMGKKKKRILEEIGPGIRTERRFLSNRDGSRVI